MQQSVTRKHAQKFVGKHIVAAKKDGTIVTGKLLRISGSRLILQRGKGKNVHTKAIMPLVLFDLLAIGTAPYAFGGGGFGFGGGYPYGGGGFGYGGGNPGGYGPQHGQYPYGGGFF